MCIYSVKSCNCFRTHWRRFICGTPAAPKRLLLKSCDEVVKICEFFSLYYFLTICSLGICRHPTPQNAQWGWYKAPACPGASQDTRHESSGVS